MSIRNCKDFASEPALSEGKRIGYGLSEWQQSFIPCHAASATIADTIIVPFPLAAARRRRRSSAGIIASTKS